MAGVCVGGAILVAEPAKAESFRLVSGSSSALLVADMDSVRRVGGVVSFSTVMFSRRVEYFNARPSWATQTANEIDCRTNQRREGRARYLAEGGVLISSETVTGGWQSIPPRSTGMAIRDLVCEGRITENNIEFGDSFGRAEEMARRVLGH
ncbi:surface-adhesin E family protein [Phenylobacterium sp.]|uniref:surface-adhesin E family protein n=1 Tax=Phenylobacterium sp. TaxID=1871053 RepID=UPI0035B0231F